MLPLLTVRSCRFAYRHINLLFYYCLGVHMNCFHGSCSLWFSSHRIICVAHHRITISHRIGQTRDCSAFQDAVPCAFFNDCCVECPKQRFFTVAALIGSFVLLLLLLATFAFIRSKYPDEVQRSITLLFVVAFYFQRADLFQNLDLKWPSLYVDAAQRTASLTSFNILDWLVEPNCIFAEPGKSGSYLDFNRDIVSVIVGSLSLPCIMLVWVVFTQLPQLCFCFSWEEFGDKAVDGLSTIVSLFFMPYFKSWVSVRDR